MARPVLGTTVAARASIGRRTTVVHPPSPSMIVVGKDVLELLSSAMYVDPLSIYREYIQNAADAIDQAKTNGSLTEDETGRVDILVDTAARRIVIRDNGAGIPVRHATQRLLAIGASTKRGTRARGFRGVGRLAGLAYGRTLAFRTRGVGDDDVVELRWDCQRLKAALRDVAHSEDISSVIQRVVTIAKLDGTDWPASFFEVELCDVIRTKRDSLLSPVLVGEYLEQVAPVPFAKEFRWGEQITAHLAAVRLGNLDISINGTSPLRRPLRNTFKVTDAIADSFGALDLLTLTDLNGGVAGLGWVLHHSYRGSIAIRSRIGGMRCRLGNVQVGDENLLEEIFPEARFNGWTVGEVHVVDPRIVPNARRDYFEENVHFSNLTAQLEPLARQIAKRARAASIERNKVRREQTSGAPAPALRTVATKPLISPDPQVVDKPSREHPLDPIITSGHDLLSAAQQQLLRKIHSLISRSGLSKDEVLALLPHL